SVQSDSSWLTANITSGSSTITPGFPATLTVGASASGLLNNTYTGHITITPNAGTATVITVTFIVGSGGSGSQGTITVDHTSFSFAYPSNTLSAILNIGTSNPSVTGFVVTFSSQNNWLVFQNLPSGTYNGTAFGGYTVSVNQAVAGSLGTGTYT